MRTIARPIRGAVTLAVAAAVALTAGCASSTDPGDSAEPTTAPSPTSTAPSPEPSGTPAETTATVVPDDDPRMVAAIDAQEFPAAQVSADGATLFVAATGSGSSACVAQPLTAEATNASEVTVAFAAPPADIACTADLGFYGWELPIDGSVDVAAPVSVTLDGFGGEPMVVEAQVA